MKRVYTSKTFPKSQLSQHFRVITYKKPDNKVGFYDLCQYIESDTGDFKSNAGKGKYDLNPNIHPIVSQGVKESIKLHRTLKNSPFAIAWDFMVTDKGPAFLEGNVVFGGLASYETARYHQRFDKFLKLFRDYYKSVIDNQEK